MATIRKRVRKDGTASWQVRWREPDGTGSGRSVEVSETFTKESLAKKFRGEVDAAGQRTPDGWYRGRRFTPEPEPTPVMTVGAWCTHAIAVRSGITDGTRADYTTLAKHFAPIADIHLTDLTRSDVSAWINSIDRAARTVQSIHGLLSSCLHDAVREGLISVNPAEGLRMPASHGRKKREPIALTATEVDLLIAAHPPEYRALVATLEGTGMRLGEGLGLQARYVTLGPQGQTGRISIVQALTRQPGGRVLKAPKTPRSVRSISITAELADRLRPLVEGRDPEALVFTNPNGSRIHANRFREDVWHPAVERARRCDDHKDAENPCGCPGTLTVRPVPHDLRHTHVSQLIAAGVPMVLIQRRLGHESIKTTGDTYGHLLPDSDDAILSALSLSHEQSAPGVPVRQR